jgi:hypothetical protein
MFCSSPEAFICVLNALVGCREARCCRVRLHNLFYSVASDDFLGCFFFLFLFPYSCWSKNRRCLLPRKGVSKIDFVVFASDFSLVNVFLGFARVAKRRTAERKRILLYLLFGSCVPSPRETDGRGS